jgi:hypothetical protein
VSSPRCKEPGCPFPVASLPDAEGRCMYCRGEAKCATKRCTNLQQRGGLCRLCANIAAPGETYFRDRWVPLQKAIVTVMRDPAMRGVTFGVELVNGEKRIVGRDGSFVIVFNRDLWALPTNPETGT